MNLSKAAITDDALTQVTKILAKLDSALGKENSSRDIDNALMDTKTLLIHAAMPRIAL